MKRNRWPYRVIVSSLSGLPMEMKSSRICNLHSCIEDSPPPNYPVQSKFMGLMFVPEFTVQYQVWCSSRLHFLTLLEPWYMQSRNRFSIVALREWQKTRLRSRLHTAFDSYRFWFKAGPDRSHTNWSRLSFLKSYFKKSTAGLIPNWGGSLDAGSLKKQNGRIIYNRMT